MLVSSFVKYGKSNSFDNATFNSMQSDHSTSMFDNFDNNRNQNYLAMMNNFDNNHKSELGSEALSYKVAATQSQNQVRQQELDICGKKSLNYLA